MGSSFIVYLCYKSNKSYKSSDCGVYTCVYEAASKRTQMQTQLGTQTQFGKFIGKGIIHKPTDKGSKSKQK